MMKLSSLAKRIKSRVGKKEPSPSVIFVSYDLSLDVLRQFDENDIGSLIRFFDPLFPSDPWLKKFLVEHQTSITTNDLLLLASHIIQNVPDGGYINVQRLESPDLASAKRVQERLVQQKWVLNVKICPPDLVKAYGYVLKGLDNYIRAVHEHPEFMERIWLHVHTITLGPSEPYDYEPTEPMNQATRKAAEEGFLEVIAAGNEGVIPGNSLNPWSVAPWVIGVGATNADGTDILETSSRGISEVPELSPTVVAPGVFESWPNALCHGHMIALRQIEMAKLPAVVMAYTYDGMHLYVKDKAEQIQVIKIQDGLEKSVPIEEFKRLIEGKLHERAQKLYGTSFAAEYVSAVCNLIEQTLMDLREDIPREHRPKLVKTLLEDMAQPLEGYKRWEQGSGVVTWEIAEAYLARFGEKDLEGLYERAITRW